MSWIGKRLGRLLMIRAEQWCMAASLVTASSLAASQSEIGGTAESQMESLFATSVILTDTEAITFGSLSFDPETFEALFDQEVGTPESVGRRRSITTYTLPGRWTLSPSDNRLTTRIKSRLTYLEMEQDLIFGDGNDRGRANDVSRVYGAFGEYEMSYRWTEQWTLSSGLGLHLMQYDNNHSAGDLGSDVANSVTDGVMFDTSATAAVGEWQARANYRTETRGFPWEFQSTYSYYAGQTVRTGNELADGQPETWSWTNGVTLRWPLSPTFDRPNHLRFSASRIDLGGDATATFGTRQYYRFGVGWLIEMPDGPSWLDNLGVSVSANLGSALSGGSLVLLYNEDY